MEKRIQLSIDEVELLIRHVKAQSVDHYVARTEPAADQHLPSLRNSAALLTGDKRRRKTGGSLDLSADDVRRHIQASQRKSLASDPTPGSTVPHNDDGAISPPDEEREGQ